MPFGISNWSQAPMSGNAKLGPVIELGTSRCARLFARPGRTDRQTSEGADILITGNMDCFFDFMPGKRCIIQNWIQRHLVFKKRPDIGNSSVFRWRANTMQSAIDKFYSERDWALDNFKPPQTYLTHALGEKYWWPETWVRSFKRHSVPSFPLNLLTTPRIPPGTRILVFHGLPDPDQALGGYRPARLHRRTRPAPWITDYWGGGTDR